MLRVGILFLILCNKEKPKIRILCNKEKPKMDWLCRSRGRRAGGRQPKLRLGRSRGAIVEFDNLAGGWLALRRGRRSVEVRVLI